MTTQLNLLQRDWCEFSEPVVLRMMRGMPFTTDDIRHYLPEPANVNYYGVLMARMKNKGLVARITYRPSKRPEANGRPIAVWTVL